MIAKGATEPVTGFAPSFYYGAARAGMRDLLERLAARLGREPRVLLPSFIGWSPHEGSGVFDPIGGLGLPHGFYRVGDDLQVDEADFTRMLAVEQPDVVVLIHYFGRTQTQLKGLTEAAHAVGAVVVEDLAHGYFTAAAGGPAGRCGDVLLYSLHKMFPMPLGGVVTYRNLDLVDRQASTHPELARAVLDFDSAQLAGLRRRNFLLTQRALREQVGPDQVQQLWPVLAPTDVPQTLPVRILTADRDRVYHAMNAAGFGVVSLYHTMIEQLRQRPDMLRLSRTIMNLPVHQDVEPDRIPDLVGALRVALRESVAA